jgi:outer membrane protein TolC
MAIWFINYDRVRERVELGQASDIDLLKANSEYQSVRKRRYLSQDAQRISRARLAQALNRPGKLPDKLTMPKLNHKKRNVPAVEDILRVAHTRNPLLNAMQQQVHTEQAKLSAYDAERWPTIYGEAELAQYSREIGSADRWRAGVTLDIPLYQGGAVASKRARQRAVVQRTQAEYEVRKRELDQALLELSLELETLYTEREERDSINTYRELYLDRARAIYDLEVKTDLGDAMVELTEAQLEAARTEFKIALGWARLEALTGQSWEQVTHEK